ncbi:MAG: hypothetical protein II621_00540, partial [Clostridia bacterium]|nr:hypothetical protein [Clostridia bacterium]
MKSATTNKIRKLLAIVLVTLLALTPLSLLSFAADDVDLSGATSFVFSDSSITVTEGSYTGYKVAGTALTINKAGTYVVSGSCANGTIVVKK